MNDAFDYTDTTKCPLCGSDNECAVAAGRDPDSCWCMSVVMSPEVLESIPPQAQGLVCVCARCATGSSGKT